MSNAIGIDVGGTKVLGGVVTAAGELLSTIKVDTPPEGGSAVIDAIADVATQLLAQDNSSCIGVTIPGYVSSDRKSVIGTPNIDGFNGLEISAQLQKRIGKEVLIENDANAALWAEYKFGAGAGHDNIVALTLGTGIGGGVINSGQLLRGAFGVAGELGHVRLVQDGLICGCGMKGCLEQYASGTALLRTARSLCSENPEAAKSILKHGDGTAGGVLGEHVTIAAREGDALAIECFNTLGRFLGAGIASICAVLDPSHVIIGGGVVDAAEILLKPTRDSLVAHTPFSGKHPVPELVAATLGNNAGLIGVADLARN
ncbi:MAG: hypothetical protein RLZZ73_230 [Actinomycetota bacterium]|jgi:glucokinase